MYASDGYLVCLRGFYACLIPIYLALLPFRLKMLGLLGNHGLKNSPKQGYTVVSAYTNGPRETEKAIL